MGYRSDVTLAIIKEEFDKAPQNVRNAFKDCALIRETEDAYYFIWDNVKWYPDYDEVKTIESFLDSLNEKTEGPHEKWGRVRIGEEYDDIETDGDYAHFNICVQRSIDIDTYGKDLKDVDTAKLFASNSVKFFTEEEEEKPKKKKRVPK